MQLDTDRSSWRDTLPSGLILFPLVLSGKLKLDMEKKNNGGRAWSIVLIVLPSLQVMVKSIAGLYFGSQ